ncbi:MAG: PilW family protein, partial [Thermoleophilia bacterium]
MSARPRDQRLRGEAGFTLVELLLAMSLAVVVLFGVLSVFDGFTSNAARQTKITDANGQVRDAMDRIVRDLRQAQTVEVADANDLVYTVTDSATQTRRERVCLDAASRLWRSSVTT